MSMSLPLALSFVPVYAALPPYLSRSRTPISPRFPMPGGTTNGLTIGTNGITTTYVPIRSALEAAAWGASSAVWSYIDRAASLGYASAAQFVGEFTALGIPIQATTSSQAVDAATGPFAKDLAGYNFSAGGASPRPSPLTNPSLNRGATGITWAPANDMAGTKTTKLATITNQLSAGAQMLHMDDPRGIVSFGGFRAHIPARDLTSQAGDFSATAVAGFPNWLAVNTTTEQRVAVGLPSNPAGLDITAWLETNYSNILHSPGQATPALVDAYLYRINVSPNEALRTVILQLYSRYLQDDQFAWLQQVKTSAGVPFSLNLYAATPMAFMTWPVRQATNPFNFAISEVPPPYWTYIDGETVGSDAWIALRWPQCAEQHLQMAMADKIGLLCLCEHKPTSLTAAPARVVKQLLRQSIMQTVMEGHIPVVPADVYMTTGDIRDPNMVAVDGYRFWGSVADYGDLFAFIRANSSWLEGYDKLAVVHVAASNDSYPFRDGDAAAVARYDVNGIRLAELWKRDIPYHLVTVGEALGTLPEAPESKVEETAPLIIQLQDPGDYMSYAGRMSGRNYRRWSTAACDEALAYSPVRSLSPYVRATARYSAGRVSVHLHNYSVNSNGTPKPQTTVVRWNRAFGTPGVATVTRLGEAPGTVDLSRGYGQVTLREYAILNFQVA